MKARRLITLLSAAAISSALLTPAVASAHGRGGHWDQDRADHRHAPAPKHRKWHHRHSAKKRHHRRDDRVRVYIDDPRRPRHTRYEPPTKLHLGKNLTIIYR